MHATREVLAAFENSQNLIHAITARANSGGEFIARVRIQFKLAVTS